MAVYDAAFGVYGRGDGFPGGDLCGAEDARGVGEAGGAGGDVGRFGDEEGSGDAGALGVVF